MSIRIALDVTPELIASTGVARYSRELRKALERRDDCEVLGFGIGRNAHPVPPATRHIAVPLRTVHLGWRVLRMPTAEHMTGTADIVHSLDLIPPPTRLPLVMTVHDLVTSALPDLHGRRSRQMQKQQLAAVRRAAAILTVSRSTAESLMAIGIDADRIHVTPNGLTPLPSPTQRPIPSGPFILTVGTLEPRKGHELLLQALAAGQFDNMRLVFAGPTAGRAQELRALAQGLGVQDRLSILGQVEDRTLAGLYRAATLLCMPSLAEGFGLPVLEAMAAGLPVVASNLPAIREVAGDSAVLVAPGHVDSLIEGLGRVLGDDLLRTRLRERGRERSRSFTWEATAEATVCAYRAVLRNGRKD